MVKPAALVIFEKKGDWAPSFRRELATRDLIIHETRSLAGCWSEIEGSPDCFVVFEVTEVNVVDVCEVLRRVGLSFPLARPAVVGPRSMAALEWMAREAGALHAVFSPRRVGPLARMVARHENARAAREGETRDGGCRTDPVAGLPWG